MHVYLFVQFLSQVEEHCKNKKHPKVETVSDEHHQRVFGETGVDLDGTYSVRVLSEEC